jgi:4'-phosphopantetheinyl transferase
MNSAWLQHIPQGASMPTLRVVELAGVDQSLHVLLDPAEIARADTFSNATARREFVAGRVAQRLMAAELLGSEPEALQSRYWCPDCGVAPVTSHGRPGYLAHGEPAPLAMSLSRSGGWVLLAMTATLGVRLGADLQRIADVGFAGFDDVALGQSEKVLLANVPFNDRTAWRASVWARKEALAKVSGLGLRTEPADIQSFPALESGIRVWDVSAAQLLLPDGFAAAVAVSAGGVVGAVCDTARE